MNLVNTRQTYTTTVNTSEFWKAVNAVVAVMKTPTVILSITSLVLLLVLPKLAGFLLLFVGSGGVGISWWQFQMANELDANALRLVNWRSLRAWGCWLNAITHLPMLIAGILLVFSF
jgi:hypothetical protein